MLNRDEFDTFLVFVIKVYLFEFFIPMYDVWDVYLFEMFSQEGVGHCASVWNVYLFEKFTWEWELVILQVLEIITWERVGHFLSEMFTCLRCLP